MNLLRLFRAVPLALLALLAVSGPLCRADGPIPPDLISIDFPGGPLSKLVATVNAGQEARLSIIQSAGLDPVLPAFSVRNAHISEVIAALGRIVEPQGYQLAPVGPNLAVLAKFRRESQEFASFQLGPKIGDGKVEDIIAAIQTGCEFANPDGKASSLRFKYHPATKLLFVAGTEKEIGIAERIYSSLPFSSPTQPAPTRDKK